MMMKLLLTLALGAIFSSSVLAEVTTLKLNPNQSDDISKCLTLRAQVVCDESLDATFGNGEMSDGTGTVCFPGQVSTSTSMPRCEDSPPLKCEIQFFDSEGNQVGAIDHIQVEVADPDTTAPVLSGVPSDLTVDAGKEVCHHISGASYRNTAP